MEVLSGSMNSCEINVPMVFLENTIGHFFIVSLRVETLKTDTKIVTLI